jgi:hypothetical protein
VIRAEPVAALYQQTRIHHVGAFPTLEDQICQFAPDFDRLSAGFSPDRVDALVWAFTDLLVEPMSQPKPAPRPEPIYAIGSQEYAAQQEGLRLRGFLLLGQGKGRLTAAPGTGRGRG